MKVKVIIAAVLACYVVVSDNPARAAQSLTKVIMTSGSFSEREAAMYVAPGSRLLSPLRAGPHFRYGT